MKHLTARLKRLVQYYANLTKGQVDALAIGFVATLVFASLTIILFAMCVGG